MSELSQLSFAYPIFLLLIVPWAVWVFWKWMRSGDSNTSGNVLISLHSELLSKPENLFSRLFSKRYVLLDGAVFFMILALANPGTYEEEMLIEGEGTDIVIALDLSSSMLARDFEPDRLEASKKLMIDFIENRPLDRFAIVAFAGESITQSPLTHDQIHLRKRIEEMECGMIDDGTAIGMGLATSLTRLRDTEPGSGMVILLTDGVNNTGYIEPMTAARMAREMGVKVYTIGVGSRGLARAPVSRNRDGSLVFGNVRVEIDEQLLREISDMTGGLYFRADDERALEEIYDIIDEMEKTETIVEAVLHFSSFYRYPAMAAMSLMFLYFLPQLILRKFP